MTNKPDVPQYLSGTEFRELFKRPHHWEVDYEDMCAYCYFSDDHTLQVSTANGPWDSVLVDYLEDGTVFGVEFILDIDFTGTVLNQPHSVVGSSQGTAKTVG